MTSQTSVVTSLVSFPAAHRRTHQAR